jgi:hypothetical protein
MMREGLRFNGISEQDVTIIPVGDEGGRLRNESAVRKIRSDGGDMKHLRRFFGRAVLGLPVLLFLGGDGYAAEMKKLTLGYSTVGPAGTGLWMAKEIGAFEKYGINADLIFISAGPVVVQALIGGDLQGGLAATNAVIAAVLGAPRWFPS